MRFLGKQSWTRSLIFWAVVLVLGFGIGMLLLGIFGSLLSIIVFLVLAHYWYKLPWLKAVVVWAVAFVIDMVIMYIVFFIILGHPNLLNLYGGLL